MKMSAVKNNYAWLAICLASIFICLKTDASPLAAITKRSPLENSQTADAFGNFNVDEAKDTVPIRKNIVARSADADDNSVDGDDENKDQDDKTEKPNSDNSEEIFPEDKNHHQSPHAHGSHGALGPVKHLLNTVRDRFHGNGGGALGGIGAVGNILGTQHRANAAHESPIETEADRTNINSSTGLHVLEFLGTLFGLLWGFLSNIPALFGSSSSGLSGGQ